MDSGRRSILGMQRGTTVKIKIEAFWRHLANFGRHFGPSWIPKGFQNRDFGHQVEKRIKNDVQKRDPKKHKSLTEVLS